MTDKVFWGSWVVLIGAIAVLVATYALGGWKCFVLVSGLFLMSIGGTMFNSSKANNGSDGGS